MTQKQFFSLFLSCIIVVSKYTIIASDCYHCNSVNHENCTLDWTEEDVKSDVYDEFIVKCTSFCTQKIGKQFVHTIKNLILVQFLIIHLNSF